MSSKPGHAASEALAADIQAFKTQYAATFVPDRIVLPPGYDSTTAQYLTSVWPRLDPATLGQGTSPITREALCAIAFGSEVTRAHRFDLIPRVIRLVRRARVR